MIPSIGGIVISRGHPLLFVLWLTWRLQETYQGHSGYSFQGSWLHAFGLTKSHRDALYHDFHHSHNQGNYAGPQQDLLLGTDKGWIKWYNNHLKSNKSL